MTKLALGLAIFLSLCSYAKAADPCPNLSGEYIIQGEDGQVRLTITQKSCEEIRIDRTNNYLGKVSREQHSLKIDGKFQTDTPWLGSSQPNQTSAKFIS